MASYKDIYKDLKAGYAFTYAQNQPYGYTALYIGESWRDGKNYIFWQRFGSSANTVSFKNLCWILSGIFKMTANEFYKTYDKVLM